ncbi:MFS transporter [Streptococcus suis]|nr:MFS transporter [Streptococcus suis]
MSQKEMVSKNTTLSIVSTALLGFAGILSETSMNVTFPTLQKLFHLPLSSLQWITTVYLLAVAISMTVSATLKQNLPEKSIMNSSLALFTVGTVLACITPSFPIMIIGRVLQGLGTGLGMTLMFNLILERVPASRIGTYMGIGGLIMSLAPAFGPTYGGFMIAHFPWQWIFICILPVPVISFILNLLYMENSEKVGKRPFDCLAFSSLAFALSSLLLAVTSLEEGHLNVTYFAVFLLSFLVFVWRSVRAEKPFLDIHIMKDPAVRLGLLPFFIYQFTNLGTNFIVPNFLIEVQGASSVTAGFALLPGTLLGAFLAPLFGKFYDLKGPKPSLYIGNSLLSVALLVMTLWTGSLTVFSLAITYIFFTFGRNMAFNNTMAVSVSRLPVERKADATAIFQMMQQFAGALGTAIASVMAGTSSNLTIGVQRVFTLQLICVVSIFFLFYRLFQVLKKAEIRS